MFLRSSSAATLSLFFIALSSFGFSIRSSQAAPMLVESAVGVTLEDPKVGVDFPINFKKARSFKNKKILALGLTRILVQGPARLSQPEEGLDFPSGTRLPRDLEGARILALDNFHRAVFSVKVFNGPPSNPEETILVMADHVMAAKLVKSIEKAQPAIDFDPQTTYEEDRDFYVLVLNSGRRIRLQ